LELEGKLWYKKDQYNSADEMRLLRAHPLRVPIASDPSRTLRFDQICPAYFKPSGAGGGGGAGRQMERFQKQVRKTPRGHSITMKRNSREY
jgi:hypothetical protein